VAGFNYTDPSDQVFNVTVLQPHILAEVYELYDRINKIIAECDECDNAHKYITLGDICFQPLSPDNKNCAVQSLFQYWQNNDETVRVHLQPDVEPDEIYTSLYECMKNPFEIKCLSSFGAPIQPFMVVGSYGPGEEDYLNAGAMVITYVINNFLSNNREQIMRAMAWEREVVAILANYSSPLVNVYYTTERSIEDEIERESKADIKIIAISYVMMFFYLTITLGKYSTSNWRVILLEMKIFLGLSGVILVLLSVFSSGGLFTYLGVPASLITLEVSLNLFIYFFPHELTFAWYATFHTV
jgi:Niemann-Pick C1 protein